MGAQPDFQAFQKDHLKTPPSQHARLACARKLAIVLES